MSIFKKTKGARPWAMPRGGYREPYALLNGVVPARDGDLRRYRRIRELVPIVDAAIEKLVRLAGGVSVECSEPGVERALNRFLHTVDTGWGQQGIQSFLDSYLDCMLTYGMAVGEILTEGNREIRAVVCRELESVELCADADAGELQLFIRDGLSLRTPAYPELILFTPLHPEPGNPRGVSILRSMPYLAETLLTIYESIRANYERSGTLRYAVTCRPGSDPLERMNAAERVQTMAEEWSRAMQSTRDGSVRDFVTLGDVDIRTIGADAPIPETEGAVRQILEQLVSRTGVPPFLLGLSWSSTERMSSQQADMMTSELWAIRRSLTHVVERVCDLWLAMHGIRAAYRVVWEPINLQDTVEEARARLYDAQAEKMRREEEAT